VYSLYASISKTNDISVSKVYNLLIGVYTRIMPIFEYKCTNERCENTDGFEQLHLKSGEERLTTCPKCGFDLDNMMSTFSPRFIGAGFYSVDYKDSAKPRKAEGKTETVTDPKELRKIKKEAKKSEPQKQS
jgi:putative FmdB family regulatory protein